MKTFPILSAATIAICLSACSPSIDMPKGSMKGYSSARLVKRSDIDTKLNAQEENIHRMIQKSLKKEFANQGKPFGGANADLIVAYVVIYQENGMTTSFDEYFGHGRDVDHIVNVAHIKGAIKETRPDSFERAGLLVDVIDAKSNKLVYRNIHVGDIVRGVSDASRAQRINAAVQQALAPFFKK